MMNLTLAMILTPAVAVVITMFIGYIIARAWALDEASSIDLDIEDGVPYKGYRIAFNGKSWDVYNRFSVFIGSSSSLHMSKIIIDSIEGFVSPLEVK